MMITVAAFWFLHTLSNLEYIIVSIQDQGLVTSREMMRCMFYIDDATSFCLALPLVDVYSFDRRVSTR